jgi:hypothetical protein
MPELDNWPLDPANGRLLCAPERPMPKDAKGRWAHTNSQIVGSAWMAAATTSIVKIVVTTGVRRCRNDNNSSEEMGPGP